jgi:hypothetical protein
MLTNEKGHFLAILAKTALKRGMLRVTAQNERFLWREKRKNRLANNQPIQGINI